MATIRKLRAKVFAHTHEYVQTQREEKPSYDDKFRLTPTLCGRTGNAIVLREDCLHVAREFATEHARVLLLNMGNPKFPGGGVRAGRGAQEEELSRRTDLMTFLEPHSKTLYPLSPGACIIAKRVRVLKGDEECGYEPLAESDQFDIDILTCCALEKPLLVWSKDSAEPRLSPQSELYMRMRIRYLLDQRCPTKSKEGDRHRWMQR